MPSPVHYIVRNLTINKATVITSLASAIPVVGNHIVSWLWGG
jgi:quinol-cytochrome oxidoreductase complex cytochrome b subunit